MTIPPLVIKIGGSLLATPGAMARVANWLARTRREGQTRLLLAGGGPIVDGLRDIDRANPLPERVSHEAAIDLMDANTRLLASWLPEVGLHAWETKGRPPAGDHAVLLGRWLREAEPRLPGERLTPGWQTTSDAIAARLAVSSQATLLIVKHYSKGTYNDLHAAAAAGVIDPECPRIAASLPQALVAGLPSGSADRHAEKSLGDLLDAAAGRCFTE